MAARWQVWVDTGGTFTDCLALSPEGELRRAKVLSSGWLRGRLADVASPERVRVELPWPLPAGFLEGYRCRLLDAGAETALVARHEAGGWLDLSTGLGSSAVASQTLELGTGEEAPLLAARLATATPGTGPLPALALRLATTRGTNALLERQGAPVALFLTWGFGDLLEIGTQQRPDLFALAVEKPRPLAAAVVEVAERLDAQGQVLRPLELDQVEEAARPLVAAGFRAAAVALLHSYRNPAHERAVVERLRELGFGQVSSSAALAPRIGLLARAETTVVDATLAEILGHYLERVASGLSGGSLHVMTSAGGLVAAKDYRAKDSLLSGPAGGVVGAAAAGRRSGFSRLITFDMGGTSTDVARYDGDYDYLFEHRVGPARLAALALAIETVAAGGGSICRFDGRQLKVGPESAGAEPGPACYGRGGPLTVTDVNLFLGRLAPERFELPLDVEAASQAAERLAAEVAAATGEGSSREVLLSGLLEIADERMAEAMRSVSIARGADPAEHVLVAFGGAGGQHACAVAELLGMGTVLVPPDAGLLSAAGLGAARVERTAERQVLAPLAEVAPKLAAWLAELAAQARRAAAGEGLELAPRRRLVHLRVVGQEGSLPIEAAPAEELRIAFEAAYRGIYGYAPEGPLEVESLRVIVASPPAAEARPFARSAARAQALEPPAPRPVCFGGSWLPTTLHHRERLQADSRFAGPALVLEAHSTTLVPPGWSCRVDEAGALVLERAGRAG